MSKAKNAIKIKVVSVGSRGCSILKRLTKLKEDGVELCAISKEGEAFNHLKIENKIELPYSFDLEQNRNIEKMARFVVNKKQKEISKLAEGTDIVFLVGNLANKVTAVKSKEISRLFKKEGSLVFFVGSTSFRFEGKAKKHVIDESRGILKKEVDALLIVDSEKIANQKITATEASMQADKVISDVIDAILDIIIKDGFINIDFADLKAIIKNSGETFFNISSGSRKDIASIVNNLFSKTNLISHQNCFSKALYVIYAGKDLLTDEIKQIGEKIHKRSGGEEKIIFGIVNDDKMEGKLKIVMIGS